MTLPLDLEPRQLAIAAAAALIIGFSKTGVPGSGILAIALMAESFGGRLSVGATLPMLILADCFAVAYYRSDAEWSRLKDLAVWVVAGLLVGTLFLKVLGDHPTWRDPLNPIIAVIVLAMLAVTVLRRHLGDRLVPHSRTGTIFTGVVAGFSTMVSNAAGPIMQIYLVATGMPKNRMMGTSAVYFFIFNLAKIPLLIWLTLDNPGQPLMTASTLLMNLALFPMILAGALLGRRLLHAIPERAFNNVVLVLSALAAIRLLWK